MSKDNTMNTLQIILGSSRQGRFGDKVAGWFLEHAHQLDGAEVELLDLREWQLPLVDSPVPPAMQESSDPRVEAWAQAVARADGYVLVTPEYNHGYPAVLKNALDLVYRPWRFKPIGFVGYGGPGAGIRAVEQLRQVVVELDMVPMRQQVAIGNVYRAFAEDGRLRDPEPHDRAARAVLEEIAPRLAVASSGRAA
jgi:NAD(P)H-dependent FMN reductase